MNGAYGIALNEHERDVLLDVLEQALKATRIEEHRTEALRAKDVVHAKETAIESVLRKLSAAQKDA